MTFLVVARNKEAERIDDVFSLRTIITLNKSFIILEKVGLRWSIIPTIKYWNCQHPPMRYKDQLNSVSVLACVCHKLSIFQINKFNNTEFYAINYHYDVDNPQHST